jgi:hypothetical protein
VKRFTKEKADAFFDLLKSELQKVKFDPAKVYNVDETGISIVQGTRTNVLSVKGKKQVARLCSAERGSLMTVVTCMSVGGIFVSPLIAFPRARLKPELLNGTHPGIIAACHPSGWIQTHIFTRWFENFIKMVKQKPDDPVVLILDDHFSHTRNLEAIARGRDVGVHIVCLPPHSTHKLQPLDVVFIGPFKKFYSQEIELWLNNHPFKAVTALHVGEIFGKAYLRVASMQTAINGCKKCGIILFHLLVFGEVDFIPDKSNGNKDHVTPMVSTRKEPDRAANVESPGHEHVGAST